MGMMWDIVTVVCLGFCEKVGSAWLISCPPKKFGDGSVGRIGSSCCGWGRFVHFAVVKWAVLETPTSYLKFSTQGGVVPLGDHITGGWKTL